MIYGIPMGILPHPAGAAPVILFIDERLTSYFAPSTVNGDALSPLLWQMNTAHAAAIDPNVLWRWSGCRWNYCWRSASCLRRGGYHQLSPVGQRTTIAGSVIDVGLRTEPNLELLTEMNRRLWSGRQDMALHQKCWHVCAGSRI